MGHIARSLLPAGLALVIAAPAAVHAQAAGARRPTPAALRRAVETISEADFRAGMGVLAHDSMRGRDTRSPQLLQAAQWVAARFRRAGLRPAGDSGGYFQRYRMRHLRLDSLSTVSARAGSWTSAWALGREIAHVGGPSPRGDRTMPVVLLSGIPTDTARPFGDVAVDGAAVLHVIAPEQLRSPMLDPLIGRGISAGAVAWILVAQFPPPLWERFQRRSSSERWELAGSEPSGEAGPVGVLAVRDSSVLGLLGAAGVDVAALRTPAGQGIRPLAGVEVAVSPHWTTLEDAVAPNVVGVLEGSDRTLRDEAVVFLAHMDHIGTASGGDCAADGTDSICNGADDNASGTVAVVELAEAYASLRPRPRRTTVFVAVSGEEYGLFGSHHYAANPVVPLERTAAAVNFDMISRASPDTIQMRGKDYTSLGALADSLALAHPELRLRTAPRIGAYGASDHYPFALRGIPTASFGTGDMPDIHRPTDNLERADFDKAARAARLAFYLGLEVANAAGRPQWDPAARARVVSGAGN